MDWIPDQVRNDNACMVRQYQIPQFITVEDKVVGPFSMKQFAYVGVALFVMIIANYLLTTFFFMVVSIPIIGIAFGLAFIKIDHQPLPTVLKHGFFFMVRPRLYVWRQKVPEKRAKTLDDTEKGASVSGIPKLSESKLSDLAWSLDMKGRDREEDQFGDISPAFKEFEQK